MSESKSCLGSNSPLIMFIQFPLVNTKTLDSNFTVRFVNSKEVLLLVLCALFSSCIESVWNGSKIQNQWQIIDKFIVSILKTINSNIFYTYFHFSSFYFFSYSVCLVFSRWNMLCIYDLNDVCWSVYSSGLWCHIHFSLCLHRLIIHK